MARCYVFSKSFVRRVAELAGVGIGVWGGGPHLRTLRPHPPARHPLTLPTRPLDQPDPNPLQIVPSVSPNPSQIVPSTSANPSQNVPSNPSQIVPSNVSKGFGIRISTPEISSMGRFARGFMGRFARGLDVQWDVLQGV